MSDALFRRRSFLSLVGGVASLGSLVVGSPALMAAAVPPGPRPPSTVGVLVPASRKQAERLRHFRDGATLAARGEAGHPGTDLQVAIEEVDIAGSAIPAAVERLLSQQRSSLIIGCLDGRQARVAVQACADHALYLDCGAGACVPILESAARGYLECSLAHWQNAYAAGRWSAGEGTTACMVSSFFEAGYDALYAFRLGYEEGGGTILSTVVVDVPDSELLPSQVVERIASLRPAVVYAALHDHQGRMFLQALRQSPEMDRSLVVGNEFMAEQLDAACLPPDGLFTCSSYDPALALTANQDFRAAYRAATAREPDSCAVLGYDATLLAGRLIDHLGQRPWRPGLGGSLTWEGPRGAMTLDLADGLTRVPQYLCRLSAAGDGVKREVLQRLSSIDERDPRIVALQRSLRSGWINPYFGE